jgi:hypothetical protein
VQMPSPEATMIDVVNYYEDTDFSPISQAVQARFTSEVQGIHIPSGSRSPWQLDAVAKPRKSNRPCGLRLTVGDGY